MLNIFNLLMFNLLHICYMFDENKVIDFTKHIIVTCNTADNILNNECAYMYLCISYHS